MMMRKIKNQNGMTLVELIVSMGLFTVVMTLTVSFFITLQKMQIMYRDRANLQQEGRIASEVLIRYLREAKSVTMTDSAGTGVSELTGTGLCSGSGASYLSLVMVDGNELMFKCLGTPRKLSMGSCSPADTCTPTSFSDISSAQVNISSLTITRGPATYPKTLKYNLRVEPLDPTDGPAITFPGYMVMANEL